MKHKMTLATLIATDLPWVAGEIRDPAIVLVVGKAAAACNAAP